MTPPATVGPIIMSDNEAKERHASTQTEAHGMNAVLRLAKYFQLPDMVQKYIPKQTEKIAINTAKDATKNKEVVKKLYLVGAKVCENVFSVFSEYMEHKYRISSVDTLPRKA
jgi:hypothetical protein